MKELTEEDVLGIVEKLNESAVKFWVDGGWGVDALVGERTRPHSDLDLAIDKADLDRARRTTELLGFQHDEEASPGLPSRLVMKDGRGREIDFHPLQFDEAGNGWQQLSKTGKAWGRYPRADLEATGVIGGRQVHCLSPELQYRFHFGYEWSVQESS
jgi:lincosamide nucleotidyltransferase A/C/D/E